MIGHAAEMERVMKTIALKIFEKVYNGNWEYIFRKFIGLPEFKQKVRLDYFNFCKQINTY